MIIFTVLLAFIAGLACGLALRPGLDRRRKLRSAYAAVRARRAGDPQTREIEPSGESSMPRDYYLAGRRERGSLAEGFGLKGAAASTTPDVELDPSRIPMPRDYYERETPEDEGILSEGFGLKPRSEGSA